MSDYFTMKTYRDSYLYMNKINSVNSDQKKNDQTLLEFLTNATRIDKDSDAFKGIKEEVKRRQTTSIIYQILLMDNVQLLVGPYELPRAFKVMDAKDPKNNRRPTIFIDCTKLIEYNNGFYICRKIDTLIAYLYESLIYLLYRYAPTKMMNSSDLLISGTSCYVSLFTYILDYLRIIGYAENKAKISYIAGLFFLTNMCGKDLDNSSKNIAARVAGIELTKINAYDLYLEDELFVNINELVNGIAKTFNLKGLNLQVFMSRWIRLVGIGTQYAVELFTSFGSLLLAAYTGAYVVQQNQIERSCGVNLIKFNNAVKNIGQGTFGNLFRENVEWKDKATLEKALIELDKSNKPPVSLKTDFSSIEDSVTAASIIKDFYKRTQQLQKLPKEVVKTIENGISVLESYASEANVSYEEGACLAMSKEFTRTLDSTPELKDVVSSIINDKIRSIREISQNSELDMKDRQRASRCIKELMEMKNTL